MKVLHKIKDSTIAVFWCPGCDESHQIDTANWEFNGSYRVPTFSPSYLTWRDPNPKADPMHDLGGKYRSGFRCHSFIKKGMIQFLDDCTHKLAGQTVALPEFKL